jgi:type I restriction enzyme S subunit
VSDTDNSETSINGEQLPPDWTMATIGDLVKVRNGYAFKSADYKDEGVLLIRQSNLGGEKVSLKKAKYLPESFLENHPDFSVNKGDILIGMSGSIGKICTYDLKEPALQNQRTGLLVFKDERQRRWFWHYLPLLERDLVKVGKGVAVQNISAKQIESFPIPVAPPDQQKRIVAEIEKQFSRLDEAVANLKRVKANLKRYKSAVLKAAVEGKLTEEWRKQHSDVEPADKLLERILAERRKKWQGSRKYKESVGPDTANLSELPAGWVWTSIGDVFEVCIGATPSRGKAEYWNGTIPWISSGEVAFCRIRSAHESITDLGLKNTSTRVHPPGTILLGMIGEGKTRGQVAVLDIEACNNQNSAAIRVSDTDVVPEYVYSFFEHEYESTRKRGSGGNQPALNKSRVELILFPLPPLSEQHQIVAGVERRLSIIAGAEAQVDGNLLRADRLRQSILKKAFSGSM